MSKFLITGGAGFIGSNIADKLVESGEKVRIIDNFESGKKEYLESVINDIELIEGDIRDADAMKKATAGMDYVLHLAALRSVPRSVEKPLPTNDVNVAGTLNVLLASRDAGVKRVVYASSSSAYGDSPELPKVETQLPVPVSPYAVSKLAGELYCAVFTRLYGLETVALRYFNVFGPRQDPESEYATVVPKFVLSFIEDGTPEVHGDGTQSRDFTYVSNVVDANIAAATAPGAGGKMFNVACGERYSILQILETLEKIFGKKIEPRFTPYRSGDVKHTLADVSAAEKVMGYKAAVGFEEGMRRTVDWFSRGGHASK